MMLTVFYPMNRDFLLHHNGAKIDHYWANWDLANMDSMLAIGVLTDRRDIYDEAIEYFRHGDGNGRRLNIWFGSCYDGGLRVQESGRDQDTQRFAIALVGTLLPNGLEPRGRFVRLRRQPQARGAEYVAQYNLGN